MRFYALRVVCQSCGASFLVGGSAAGDLAQWRRLTVECRRCSAETPTANGETVDLQALAPEQGAERPAVRIPRA
jgi:hypothetical protein